MHLQATPTKIVNTALNVELTIVQNAPREKIVVMVNGHGHGLEGHKSLGLLCNV